MEIRQCVVAGGSRGDTMLIFDEMVLQKWCLDSRNEKGGGVEEGGLSSTCFNMLDSQLG